MLLSQLSATASVSTAGRLSVTTIRATNIVPSTTLSLNEGQRRSFWRGKRHWESPLDPEFHSFHRKRQQRVRAALKDALRRRSKWQVPISFARLFGARQASHWSKSFRGWPRMEGNLRKSESDEKSPGYWDNYELSPGEKRWKRHMEAVRQAVYSDPFHAISGRRSMWDSFLSERGYGPSSTVQDSPVANTSPSGSPSRAFSTTSQGSKEPKFRGYAESSSFSYSSKKEPGKAPVVEATSSKWNSATNTTTTYRYDPVTSRMVPVGDGAPQQSDVDSLSAESIRGRMGDGAAVAAGEESKRRSAHQYHMAQGFDASSRAIDRQTRDAQQSLSEADGYSTEPIGMQTSFSEERIASTNERQPTLAEQIASQTIAVEESDGYSRQPMGMQTSYTTESGDDAHPSLAEELSTNTEEKDLDDGYSQEPVGMQTNYEAELQDSERVPLDEELLSNTTEVDVDDGYSKQPIGMQINYSAEMEDQGQSALEEELSSNTKEVHVDDGYSQNPIGMQTSFSVELKECDEDQRLPLEEELSAYQTPTEITDGFSLKPASTYKFVDVRIKDDYSKVPVGMQTSYVEEQQACAENKQVPLEQEISDNLVEAEVSDGYSREPKGMQTSYKSERVPLERELAGNLAPEKFDDGYSNQPTGIETSYNHEQMDCAENRRVSLEEEIASPAPEIFDDGYTNNPTGLQNTYEQEHKDVSSHVRRSLAEEIEYNDKISADAHWVAAQYKDGYANSPSGLQTSYNKEHTESSQGTRQTLEEELQAKASDSDAPRGVQFLYGQNGGYDDPDAPGLLKHQNRIAAEEALANELEAQKTAKGAYEGRNSTAKPHVSKETKRPFHASSGAYEKTLQGEGDISENASDFTSSGKWYKRTSSSGTGTSNEDLIQDIVRIATEGGLLKQHSELQAIQDQVMAKLRSLEKRINNVADTAMTPNEYPSITWADPPAYKILAYDSSNDAIETVTTTSRFADREEPISVANAMSKVLEPARFVSYYAGLQREGYQAIHASDNLLVFRKVQQQTGAEAAAFKSTAINPVDGTARQPATGNFASPTGFVNHDPVFPIEDSTSAVLHDIPSKEQSEIEDGVYFRRRQHPRVHRQETVFSGRRVRDNHHEDNAHHGSRHRGFRRERRPAWKRRVRFAVSVGLTSAALVYALGVGAELARGDKVKTTRGGVDSRGGD